VTDLQLYSRQQLTSLWPKLVEQARGLGIIATRLAPRGDENYLYLKPLKQKTRPYGQEFHQVYWIGWKI
jgi:hypothetical protein